MRQAVSARGRPARASRRRRSLHDGDCSGGGRRSTHSQNDIRAGTNLARDESDAPRIESTIKWRHMAKHSAHILDMARKGAGHRYEELKAEIALLVKNFPHLRGRSPSRGRQIDVSAEPAATIDRTPRRRRGMSAAARRAVSARMKKYWAARRAGRKK